MPPAARITDLVLQDAPHCHAPILRPPRCQQQFRILSLPLAIIQVVAAELDHVPLDPSAPRPQFYDVLRASGGGSQNSHHQR